MNRVDYGIPGSKPPYRSGMVVTSRRLGQRHTPFDTRSRIEVARFQQQSIESRTAVDVRELAWNDLVSEDDYRHWSPESQPYAPADVLLQYLRYGWELTKTVGLNTMRCVSRRCARIYSFEVTKGNERICIPVVANPVVSNLIRDYGLTVMTCDRDSPSTFDCRESNGRTASLSAVKR